MTLAVRDIAWFAGIMEGEGYFGLRKNGGLTLEVTMTDKDVIDRVASMFSFGTRAERSLPSGKTAYWWGVTKQSAVAGLMMTLLPLMGKRRQAKIIECLTRWKETPLPKKRWTHCKSGHALTGENLKVIYEGKYAKRRCIECGRLRQQKYRSSKISSGIFQL